MCDFKISSNHSFTKSGPCNISHNIDSPTEVQVGQVCRLAPVEHRTLPSPACRGTGLGAGFPHNSSWRCPRYWSRSWRPTWWTSTRSSRTTCLEAGKAEKEHNLQAGTASLLNINITVSGSDQLAHSKAGEHDLQTAVNISSRARGWVPDMEKFRKCLKCADVYLEKD